MLGVNLNILLGNVGKDVKTIVLNKGTDREVYISNFSICTNGFERGKVTEEWHRIVVIGEMAQKIISPYVKSGSPIFLMGETRTRPSTEINPATGKPVTYYKEVVVDYKGMIRLLPDGRSNKTPEPAGVDPSIAEAEAQYAAIMGGNSQPVQQKAKAEVVEPPDLDQRGAPTEQLAEQAGMRQPTTQHKGRQKAQSAAQAAEEALAAGVSGEEVSSEMPI